MVITLDFESSDPGSNPGRTSIFTFENPPLPLPPQTTLFLQPRSVTHVFYPTLG